MVVVLQYTLPNSMLALWILVAFLAYERGSRGWMVAGLVLATLTRPQGFIFTLLLMEACCMTEFIVLVLPFRFAIQCIARLQAGAYGSGRH